MTEKQLAKIINNTVSATITKMKVSGMIKVEKKNLNEALEELLRNYPLLKDNAKNGEYTDKVIKELEAALMEIEKDPYFQIIPKYYFEKQSREKIALDMEKNPTTISRNKKRLLGYLKITLFTDEYIKDLIE